MKRATSAASGVGLRMVTRSANGSIRVSDTLIRTVNNVRVPDVPAKVVLNLSPTPRIHIEFDSIELPSHFDESAEALNVSLDSTVNLKVRTDLTRYERTQGKLLCKGPFILPDQSVTAIEPRDDLREVKFGLLNFPDFLGEEYLPPRTISGGYQRRDIVTLGASGWVIEGEVLQENPGGNRAITHRRWIRSHARGLHSARGRRVILYK